MEGLNLKISQWKFTTLEREILMEAMSPAKSKKE